MCALAMSTPLIVKLRHATLSCTLSVHFNVYQSSLTTANPSLARTLIDEMSEENPQTSISTPTETGDSVTLVLSNAPPPDPESWEHVVVSLSSRKQDQIMSSVRRSHSEASPFGTWSVIGEALSTVLLAVSAGLYMQSTMKVHNKDFLLFKQTKTASEEGTKGIIEVDFTQKLESSRWQGHWQIARPTLAHFVKNSESRPNIAITWN